jgi:hypothetical protein
MQTENLSFEKMPFAISEILARVQKIETLIEATPLEVAFNDPEPFIYGITGLAKFLKVSLPTAQKIKNSGRIPFSQAERTIIFRKADVLAALSNTNKKRR